LRPLAANSFVTRGSTRFAVGVLSGTSADAIDVALVRDARRAPRIVAALAIPYSHPVKARLHDFASLSARDVADLHRDLGERFARAVMRLLARAGVDRRKVAVIGSHGQTIMHVPGRSTLQIGAPAVIAARTGIPVAADFRLDDIAVGGQGAPFAPILDRLLLGPRSRRRRLAALNLGGIANVTIIENNRILAAYDIGPANTLIDLVMRRDFGMPFDRAGKVAAAGTVNDALLNLILKHPYFRRRPPKSTGPELFGREFLKERAQSVRETDPAALVATLTEATALSVANDLMSWKVRGVFVSGGGCRNPILMHRLKKLLAPSALENSAALGVDSDFKEAVLFAHLGSLRLHETPVDLRAVTGAKRPKILGGLWLP
jgi:anhydro-N-acetylmuramic acid kinase